MWPRYFLDSNQLDEFRTRSKSSHPYLDLTGPPNLLLENTGFEFVVSRHNSSVESWHKTFQAAWCDFDNDGDQDLYVCNDFAPDDFYRNDNGKGFDTDSEDAPKSDSSGGMGMGGMKERADLIKCFFPTILDVISKPGIGSTISLEIDLP